MDYQTADLCDKHEERVRSGELRVLEPMLNSYGGREAFHGRIATLKLFEDNSLVRKALEAPGEGRVLVVDGGRPWATSSTASGVILRASPTTPRKRL